MSTRIAALVACDGAARTFGKGPSAVVAVHTATCRVTAGDRIAITGSSGSGKSTLLHLMAGLDQPTGGTVGWPALAGAPLRPGPVSVIFQNPSLLPELDVVENVALPLLLVGADPASATAAATAALERLDLAFLAHKLPEEISGGQAQRVAVARTLAGRPRLVVADEPTGQLDHTTAAHVLEALLDAAAALDAAVVLSTHDPAVAAHFPIRWHMSDGGLDTQGHPCSP